MNNINLINSTTITKSAEPKKKPGIKKCPSCETRNGARAFNCKKCNYEFKVKGKRGARSLPIENWQELEEGVLIRVLSGSGPFFVDSSGDKRYFTERGVYKVVGLDKTGLHCYREKGGGYSYIYMGEEQKSDLADSMYKSPHKLYTVNRKQEK